MYSSPAWQPVRRGLAAGVDVGAVLEHALADGQLLDRQKALRLTAVLRRVVPINTMQVNG